MTTPSLRQCSVLLLKAADAKYEVAFRVTQEATKTLEFNVHFAEVLAFEFVNVDVLRDILVHLENFGAILVTSPRAGTAIRNVVDSLDVELQKKVIAALQDITVFSVGKATSRELECFGVQCQGDECGSADVMAQYLHEDGILPQRALAKPVVFLCGDKRRDALPHSFQQRQLPFTELAVYRTCAIADFSLPDECGKPDWIVYFSPSGIKATRTLAGLATEVTKAAIGKTTAIALDKVAEETGLLSWAAAVVAPNPTAESLAQAIANYELTHLDLR